MIEEQLKQTLNLPKTDFAMKANLPVREPEFVTFWQEKQIYQKIRHTLKGAKKFVLLDGPPYANGAIHTGHAVNKTLKDMIIKSKTLSGFDAPYVPGWDCHGLPIELIVEKKKGKAGGKLTATEFRRFCREYAQSQLTQQRSDFMRLGVMGDWDHYYATMQHAYEGNVVRALANIVKAGHVHSGEKPVHWCVECGSALAEAEVEYKDKNSPSIYVKFTASDSHALAKQLNITSALPIACVIWTTTPWTLPANQGIAVNAEFEYALALSKKDGELLIVAKDLVEALSEKLQRDLQILETISGKQLEHATFNHPFLERVVPVVLGAHVTLDAGTGCVHTAPAHGQEDYQTGLHYNLPIDNPVDAHGRFFEHIPFVGKQNLKDASETILTLLTEKNALLHSENISHSYPHCWRHKTPLIFRATRQWFIRMDQAGLRQSALKAIRTVKWVPQWGETRITNMIAERPDWCISRQRFWGVPTCFVVHKVTGQLHPNMYSLMQQFAEQIAEKGVESWYDIDLSAYISDAEDYEKLHDTLDVWFESGVAHFAVSLQHADITPLADLYLEGSDQHRGWFHSSLLTSCAMYDKAPYQSVLTHGYVVDAAGHKMSKSLGNGVAPEDIFKTLGADVLRLWVASTDFRVEIHLSDEILKRTAEAYRRIRNTARFLLSNLYDFDPKQHLLDVNDMVALDSHMVAQAHALQQEIIAAYETYEFHSIYQKLHNFCVVDLGGFYLDIIKDRQYTCKTESKARRSAQSAVYYILHALVRWIAPILSFTAEEIWQNIPGEKTESVFLNEWFVFPHISAAFNDDRWNLLKTLRVEVNQALEQQRAAGVIGSNLEAEVTLSVSPEAFELLEPLKEELKFLFIVSKVHMIAGDSKIEIKPSQAQKCARCWHRTESVGQNAAYASICTRCVENIVGKGEWRLYF